MIRLALALLVALACPAHAGKADTEAAFQAFLSSTVRDRARAAGVSEGTFAQAVAGLTLDWSLPDLAPPGTAASGRDVFQSEFRNPGRYLDADNLAALTRQGRTHAATHAGTLARIEAETGVPAGILLAIWGRESNYGQAKITLPAIRTLATQAFLGSRKAMFLDELVAALLIVEEDHIPLELLRSSWAGALGQPQFLPSKFHNHAADGDGDGRRDIWTSTPDTLASIGRYLRDYGWQRGRAWGAEVIVPPSVSCALEGPEQGRPVSAWAADGVARLDGAPLGRDGDTAYLMMPAGRSGPGFLVSENFYVLKAYNESDLYALFVGHLADRIAGAERIRGVWGGTGGFTRGDVRDLQRRLEAAGHDVGGADGLVGFRTRIAIGRTQEKSGEPATCFPDATLLGR